MRFISHHEIEWRLIGDGVRAVIVCKFSIGDLVSPGTRVASTEDPKVCFNLLVNVFSFTIRLRVIHGQEGEVVVKESPQFLDKGGCKLWALISDDLVIESKA